jgi:outer membrane protein assembly factor BamA
MRRLISATAFLAAAAACLPVALRAQDAGGPAGGPIDSIEVEGYRRVSIETIRNTIGITPPTIITFRDVQRAIRALFSLQQFDDVAVTHRAEGERSILHFALRERPLVARMTIRGTDKLSERSVRERV